MNLIDYCIQVPNIELFGFYIIFIIAIPMLLIKDKNILIFYLSLLLGIANTLALTGKPYVFTNLYSLKPTNFFSMLSTNFINVIIIGTIIFKSINIHKNYNINVVTLSIISIIICNFVLMTKGLEFIISKSDQMMTNIGKESRFKLHRLITGVIGVVFIIILEKLSIKAFTA